MYLVPKIYFDLEFELVINIRGFYLDFEITR